MPVEGKVDNGTGLSLSGITVGDAGSVTLKIFSNSISNNLIDGTDYSYYVYNKSDIGTGNQVNQGHLLNKVTMMGSVNQL